MAGVMSLMTAGRKKSEKGVDQFIGHPRVVQSRLGVEPGDPRGLEAQDGFPEGRQLVHPQMLDALLEFLGHSPESLG
jgi:hypothetical protein